MLKVINQSIQRPNDPPRTNYPPPPWENNEAWLDHARKQPDFENPMPQQLKALKKAWPRPNFALFHAMGLGKTFTAINLAAGRYRVGMIDATVVVCPTSVKLVWPNEFEKWCPIEYKIHIHESGGDKETDRFVTAPMDKMKVLIFGIEAMSQGKAHEFLLSYVLHNRAMFILDESSSIKNYKSKRTKRCITAGDHSKFKIIMTGTEITQGIHDLWAQYRFLHEKIIGHKSYFGFRAAHCVMGGFQGKQIIGYRNVGELLDRLVPFTDAVTKQEAMPYLPPKLYEQRIVQPSADQIKVMLDLKDLLKSEHAGERLEIETVLERLTRYQQIVGGFFPYEKEIVYEDGLKGYVYETQPFDKNPKLDALLEIIESLSASGGVIIWARYKPEMALIAKALEPYGTVVEFHGGIDYAGRQHAVKSFQTGGARFFVSNPTTGGMGLTLTAATTAIYYSNTFSYQDRVQSEDRCHRKGTVNAVTYIDIVMNHAIDKLIVATLKNKSSMAKYVRDELIARQL